MYSRASRLTELAAVGC